MPFKYTHKIICQICHKPYMSRWARTKTCLDHRKEWKLRIRRVNSSKWYYKNKDAILAQKINK